jgi:hypothetical protein
MTSCFSNKIRKITSNTAPTAQLTPRQDPPSPFPSLLPAIVLFASPGAGSRLAAGHPQGLALTPARTAPHCQSREQGVAEMSALRQAQGPYPTAPFDKLRAQDHFNPEGSARSCQGFSAQDHQPVITVSRQPAWRLEPGATQPAPAEASHQPDSAASCRPSQSS